MTAALDSLTVLTTKGPLATKRFTAVSNGSPREESYGRAQRFSFDERPVSAFDEMTDALKALQHRSRSFVVRGKPAEGINRDDSPRRLRPRGNQSATLVPQPRYSLPLDMDSIPCPAGVDPIFEPDAVVEHVVEQLLEEFHGISVFWSFTPGHGIKPGIRLRLWYWLDRPLADWEIKVWLARPIAEKLIDPVLYNPVQAIYTAAPIFVGMADPVPHRCGIWRGHSDAVEVPPIEAPRRRAASMRRLGNDDPTADPTGAAWWQGGIDLNGGGYAAYRSQIGDGPLRYGFFTPLKAAIGAFVNEAGDNADTTWLRADLERAIREAPHNRDDAYIEFRVADLDPLIAWTIDREREKAGAAVEPCKPTYPAPLGSVDDARHAVEVVMKHFAGVALTWLKANENSDDDDEPDDPFAAYGEDDPNETQVPVLSVNADLGVGKTLMFVIWVIKVLVASRYRPVLAVPRHKLGDEVVRKLAEHGVIGRVYRGRDALDPEDPDGKATMCRDLARVNEIERALGDAAKQACQHKDKECEFFNICGYQKQRKEKPHVWIIAHQLLFRQKPGFIKCDALGIDESFYNAALHGTEKLVTIDLDDFLGDRRNARDMNPTHDLVAISRRAHDVLAAHPEGRISRSTFRTARFTASDVQTAYAAEWRRKLKPQIWPGMDAKKAGAECARVAMHNQQVNRLARFWRLLGRTLQAPDERSPWLEVRHTVNEKNQTKIEVAMVWRDDIHKSWHVPTMVMDATMPVAIVRQFFPQMEEPITATAAMPHTYVRQITDRPMAASMLIPSDKASERENRTRCNNIEKVRRYIEVRAADVQPGRVLVVCQEGLETELRKGRWSNGVEFRHYNDIAGENAFSDVDLVIVIGRTEPSARTVEKIARTVFGTDIAEIPADDGNVRYPRVERGIRMRDGSGRKVEGHEHPDWRAEAVRWQICEAGLIQTIGRGRGVNRKTNSPLQIDIITNVCLPLEVDEITTWDRIQPGLAETMRARGVVPLSYRDMAAAHADLFDSAEAARKALGRENPGQTPIEEYLIGVCPGFLSITYRRTGSRGLAARLLYDRRRVDPAAWLAERIGDVVILGAAEPSAADAAPAEPNPERAAETEPVSDVEPPAAPAVTEPGWLDAMAIAEPTPPPARPIASSSIGIGELFIVTGIRSPPGAQHCAWIVDASSERIRRCGELVLDGLDRCAQHRRQYAETLLANPPPMPPAKELAA